MMLFQPHRVCSIEWEERGHEYRVGEDLKAMVVDYLEVFAWRDRWT